MSCSGYLIERAPGEYVARPGSKHSYTRSVRQAEKFASREIAASNACDNERVVALWDRVN